MFARALKLKSLDEWQTFVSSGRRPSDIPARPDGSYKRQGWAGYDDWLGKEDNKRPFAEARAFVGGLGFRTVLEWRAYTGSQSFPANIPKNPDPAYAADGWIDWGDWLGTGRTGPWRRKWRPFEEARAFVQNLGLTNWYEYATSGQRPKDIPFFPQVAYANEGWTGFKDWMGIKQKYLPLNVARNLHVA